VHSSAKLFLAGIGLALIYDGWAHWTHRAPTLTYSIVRHVPAELTLTFLIWLLLHFTLFYRGRR
jgi:hypothetical protein